MLSLLILSFGVAADATAVAIAAAVRGMTLARGLLVACCFGIAQAGMAAIGWAGGAALEGWWSAWDHWIALGLLTFVGLKMIREAFLAEEKRPPAAAGFVTLLVLSVATSIDALAVGVSLPALRVAAPLALAAIGLVTLLLSAAGAAFGRFLGERFGRVIEVAGGAGLIGIGVRIVIEHT